MYPALLRFVTVPAYQRERLDTPDDDFLDIDWLTNDNERLVIICHGLEGNSTRPYIAGMANIFNDNGFDVLAINYRGCSGESNQQIYSYHSGFTQDIELVVNHAIAKGYENISLVGFSLGGNLVLKYLGEQGSTVPHQINHATVFSVPLDLHDCAIEIHKPHNFLYEQRFLKNFRIKVKDKARQFDELDDRFMSEIKSVFEFDERFTAPINGFKGAVDYYEQCSSINFVESIEVPTLIVNAENDPFLGSKCYETKVFESLDQVTFELPRFGGHCGFPNNKRYYWSELRALEFAEEMTLREY